MYYRNEGRGEREIGEGKKKKEEEKDFHGTLMACSLFRNSRLFLPPFFFFFFIPLQMQIADYLPIVILDRV